MNNTLMRTIKWLGIALAALLVVHTVLLIASGLAVRRAYNDLRRGGRPMTAAEIIPPAVPDQENAALLYQGAFALLKAEPSGDDSLLSALKSAASACLDEPDAIEHRRALESLLENEVADDALGIVERAAARPKCRFDVQYDQGAAMLLPHINGMLAIGRVSAAKALLDAERGETEQAWRTMETALRTAEALRTEPTLISQLVRIAQVRSAVAAAQRVCNSSMPDGATATRIEALLDVMDDDGAFALAMDGERLLMGEWAFDWARRARLKELFDSFTVWGSGRLRIVAKIITFLPAIYRPAFQADHAAYLRTMHGFAEGVVVPLSEAPAGELDDESRGLPRYCILSRLLLPALSVARTRFGMAQAELRVLRGGIALKRHKVSHGHYPDTLTEVDPQYLRDELVDPFSGRPLIYRAEGNGFVLYSVGENRQDDGGKPEPTKKQQESLSRDEAKAKAWDLVWRSEN